MGREEKGLISWFASNHVAANLLAILVVVWGIQNYKDMKVEVFPEIKLNTILVNVAYPGAGPEEVEEGVVKRIEDAVYTVDGIKEVRSISREGFGSVVVLIDEGHNENKVLNDVKVAVDSIANFPEDAEKPVIFSLLARSEVMTIAVFGNRERAFLKDIAHSIREDLLASEVISQVDIVGVPRDEVSIEVSNYYLEKLSISVEDIAKKIALEGLSVGGGKIIVENEEILVRTGEKKITTDVIKDIRIGVDSVGNPIFIREIANVIDDFDKNSVVESYFDGSPAVMVRVFRVGNEKAFDIANYVYSYVDDLRDNLPPGVKIALWNDETVVLRDRFELLIRNGRIGFFLVLFALLLFLDSRLAFWTTLGIPISFIGSFIFIPNFDVSINMISLFAFILSLGIVVDDAIVISESIYSKLTQGLNPLKAAIEGAYEVAIPVVFSVLTTIVAFVPLLFVAGNMGQFFRHVPVVVISVLVLSLLEALLVLPAHLQWVKPRDQKRAGWTPLSKLQDRSKTILDKAMNVWYLKIVVFAIDNPLVVIAVAFSLLLVFIGIIVGGFVPFDFLPPVESDNVVALVKLPSTVSLDYTRKIVEFIEKKGIETVRELENESGEKLLEHVSSYVGIQPDSFRHRLVTPEEIEVGPYLGDVNIQLVSSEKRTVSSETIKEKWREKVGLIPGVESVVFAATIFGIGPDITVELSHKDRKVLAEVAVKIKEELNKIEGVREIIENYSSVKREVRLKVNDVGKRLGLTDVYLGRVVRNMVFGIESYSFQRNGEEVKIVVRVPKKERRDLSDLENLPVILPKSKVKLRDVAELNEIYTPIRILRAERSRVLTVNADIDESQVDKGKVKRFVYGEFFPSFTQRFPGLKFRVAGGQKEERDAIRSLADNFILSLFAIYALLAVVFRSYLQPVIVMIVIPFGFIGAFIGHVILGLEVTILSLMGIVALAGVVVNNSLILIDRINKIRAKGTHYKDAIIEGGLSRFRAIFLTSLTTFLGLTPLIFERSIQARILIPMATSLGFGILFSFFITLVIVPAFYSLLIKIKLLR